MSRRKRRTKAEIETICGAMFQELEENRPMTVRQMFYRMVSKSVVPKTENVYKSTIGRLLVCMGKEGRIPYDWITDNTRWQRKPQSFQSMEVALEHAVKTYRRVLWADQGVYSVDVDAIHPRVLQQLVESCIERHVDQAALNRTRCIELEERRALERFVSPV